MSPEEITSLVNAGESLTRAHIVDLLNHYNDPDNSYINIQTFLEGISTLNNDQKITILNDLESYD
jgi:Ca2+-binding EF-hand superfamily protein